MSLTADQFEAILENMFRIENEIDRLKMDFIQGRVKEEYKHLAHEILERKRKHYKALTELINTTKK